MTITDRAIILSRQPWREHDKRVVFLTRNHGKLDAIAIGAHKIRSKLAGHLEPLRSVDVMFAIGRRAIFKVAQAVTVDSYVAQPLQPRRVMMQGTVCRLVDRATVDAHSDLELFEIAAAALAEINFVDERALDAVFGKQLFLLAEHFGYAPQCNVCVVCGGASEQFKKFSPALGGVVCATCPAPGGVLVYSSAPEELHIFVSALLRWRNLL